MVNIYIPQILGSGTKIQGTINTILTGIILVCVVLIIIEAIPKWIRGKGKIRPTKEDLISAEPVAVETERI